MNGYENNYEKMNGYENNYEKMNEDSYLPAIPIHFSKDDAFPVFVTPNVLGTISFSSFSSIASAMSR